MSFLRNSGVGLVASFLGVLLFSCEGLFKQKEEKRILARVGESYLYQDDIASLVTKDMSPQDSSAFVVNYINNWAAKKLLLTKSKINLPEEKLAEFDRLVSDYRTDLYTRAYLEALVQQTLDTTISFEQLHQFYDAQKQNFKLDERLVQLRFVVLPNQFLNKDQVVDKIKSFNEEDKSFLDSIAVQFNKLHLNDSVWVSASRVMAEIPPLNYSNQDRYLKKSQFFELQDSLGVYLGEVNNVLEVNEVAPLGYIEPNIREIILSRRRLEKMRKLESDVLDEAIQQNEFEVYGNKE